VIDSVLGLSNCKIFTVFNYHLFKIGVVTAAFCFGILDDDVPYLSS
jgi:hypothetical protein